MTVITNNIPAMMDSLKAVEQLVERYPWWTAARVAMYRLKGSSVDAATELVAALHSTAVVERKAVDIERLMQLSADDIIDRFLSSDHGRIVAEEGEAEDVSAVEFDVDEEDMVSEELAEIYLNQGLYSEAIDTYRKLSLLNSEKSIYFAGLIAQIEDKMKS